jgi:hypothetical protein
MCDNCGEIFSVNSDGWVKYTSQDTRMHPQNNQPIVVSQKELHMCGNCNQGAKGNITPRLPVAEIQRGK